MNKIFQLKIAQGFGIVNASQNEINSTKIASEESTNGVRKLIIILTGARLAYQSYIL